jgi:hypothetical protein
MLVLKLPMWLISMMRYAEVGTKGSLLHHDGGTTWVFRTNVTADFGIVTGNFGPS